MHDHKVFKCGGARTQVDYTLVNRWHLSTGINCEGTVLACWLLVHYMGKEDRDYRIH